MALTYGFYNSLNGDRTYDAIQFGSIFDGILIDGIFGSIGDMLQVVEGSGMDLQIGTGKAWFNGTWTNNDSLYTITIGTAHPVLSRYDVVVLEINGETNIRANSFKVIEGEAASEPTIPELTNTDNVHQYPLAYVLVDAASNFITQDKITNKVGSLDTPLATGPLQSISTEDLVNGWREEFEVWFDSVKDILETLDVGEVLQLVYDHDHSEDLLTPVVGLGTNVVEESNIINDAVSDAKIGYRVPKATYRVGASSTNWNDGQGSSSDVYLTDVRMYFGVRDVIIQNGSDNLTGTTIQFPYGSFNYIPLVFITLATSADVRGIITNISASEFQVTLYRTGSTGNLDVSILWQAVGEG